MLGGTLSALDEVGPDQLGIPRLIGRVAEEGISEVILALNATVEGQDDRPLHRRGAGRHRRHRHGPCPRRTHRRELDYLDDGTISAALCASVAVTPGWGRGPA